jgi:hypothetical protein
MVPEPPFADPPVEPLVEINCARVIRTGGTDKRKVRYAIQLDIATGDLYVVTVAFDSHDAPARTDDVRQYERDNCLMRPDIEDCRSRFEAVIAGRLDFWVGMLRLASVPAFSERVLNTHRQGDPLSELADDFALLVTSNRLTDTEGPNQAMQRAGELGNNRVNKVRRHVSKPTASHRTGVSCALGLPSRERFTSSSVPAS